jgi:hypothetical protein
MRRDKLFAPASKAASLVAGSMTLPVMPTPLEAQRDVALGLQRRAPGPFSAD